MPRYHSPGFEPVDTVVVQNSNPYSMGTVDTIVEFNLTTPAAISVIGPNNLSPIGKIYTIKDGAGNAASFNITFTPASGTGTIDGVTSKVINTNYGTFSFYFDGVNLQTVNSGSGGGGGSSPTVVPVTATTKTLSITDANTIQDCSNVSAQTITIPLNASVAFPLNTIIQFEMNGAGSVTVAAASGVTLNGNPTGTVSISTQFGAFYIRQESTNVWYAEGTSGGGGSSAFGFLTSGTNTTAAMVVGTGASLSASGTGTIAPTTINGLITNGSNITITGSGTSGSPYSIAASGSVSSDLGTAVGACSPQISGDATSGFYTSGAAKVDVAISNSKIVEWSTTGQVVTGTMAGVSTSATALSVGANGATTPVLNVDASTASQVGGITIKGGATGATTTITATDSGSNQGMTIATKGTGVMAIDGGTGGVNLRSTASTTRLAINGSGSSATFTPAASTSITHFIYTGPADLTITASTEVNAQFFNNAANVRQHATGALATQRDFLINGATDSFVGASTLTNAGTLGVVLKSAGTNATITNVSGIYIPTSAVTGTITNSYGINIVAASGATNNYAALLSGQVVNGGATPAIAAGAGTGGTSPTISGANNGGVISVTTGASPTGTNAVVATVTYTNPFPNGSSVVLYPANAATALLSGVTMVYAAGSTTTFIITSGTTALSALTAYSWNYVVVGY